MWYRTAKKIVQAQELNIPGPIYGLPGATPKRPIWTPPVSQPKILRPSTPSPEIPQEGMVPEESDVLPQEKLPESVPDDGIPDEPNPINLSPEQQQILSMRPPLHDRCHCSVETLPGGRMIWNVNETACADCHSIASEFNRIQSSMFDA